MADFITVGVEGEEKLERALTGYARDLEAPIRPVARPLSDEVYLMVRAQYASRGRRGPTGREWTRKQSTIDAYTAMNRKGFSVINEEMRLSDTLFISESTRGAPHGIYDVQDSELTMGTDLIYGRIWQDRGQKQYDPTEGDVRNFRKVIQGGLLRKAVDRGFDYQADSGEIPF